MDIMKVEHDTSEENVKLICVDNFDKICRTCLSETIDLRPCFDIITDNMCAANLIADYTSVLVASDDFFPQNICNVCIAALLSSHTFKLNCINNEKILSIKKSEINKIDLLIKHENNLLQEIDVSPNNLYVESQISESSQINNKSVGSNIIKCSNKKLNSKVNVEKNPVQYKCRECDEGFDSSKLRKNHYARVHKKRNKECPVCTKMLFSGKMKQHMRTHTKEKPYICELCSEGFSVKANLRRHMMTHTGERPHVCEYCGIGFIQATSLAAHRVTHSVPKSVVHGPKPERRNKRKTSEENIEEFACDQCKRSYKTKSLLKSHQLTHREKTFLCSDCGKGFSTKAQLTSHTKVHTAEKPHTCTVCQKSFAHLGNFRKHMYIHTGYKPFKCDICTKPFRNLANLKYHMRAHKGERPYKCKICGKSFNLKGYITVHMRIHTGERPYSCPVCNKGFCDLSSMKKHRRIHGEIHNDSLDQKSNAES